MSPRIYVAYKWFVYFQKRTVNVSLLLPWRATHFKKLQKNSKSCTSLYYWFFKVKFTASTTSYTSLKLSCIRPLFHEWFLGSQDIKIVIIPGAIIGDGDRKRASFLVLGLAPWYGTIFLFLEQIAPSPAAHARTLLRGFSRMSRRGNGVRNSRNGLCFWPTTQRLYGCWNFD